MTVTAASTVSHAARSSPKHALEQGHQDLVPEGDIGDFTPVDLDYLLRSFDQRRHMSGRGELCVVRVDRGGVLSLPLLQPDVNAVLYALQIHLFEPQVWDG